VCGLRTRAKERGLRAGTENVLLVVGLGAAAEIVDNEAAALRERMAATRDRLQHGLCAAFPAVRLLSAHFPAFFFLTQSTREEAEKGGLQADTWLSYQFFVLQKKRRHSNHQS
jgi:hypothetical protein